MTVEREHPCFFVGAAKTVFWQPAAKWNSGPQSGSALEVCQPRAAPPQELEWIWPPVANHLTEYSTGLLARQQAGERTRSPSWRPWPLRCFNAPQTHQQQKRPTEPSSQSDHNTRILWPIPGNLKNYDPPQHNSARIVVQFITTQRATNETRQAVRTVDAQARTPIVAEPLAKVLSLTRIATL
jgi:hypothetical protein